MLAVSMILSRKKLNRIIMDSFGIKASEMVLITGPAKWMYAVAVECEKVGALPLLCLDSPQIYGGKVSQTKFRSVTNDQLLSITEEIDAWIEICLPFPRINKPEVGVVMPDWIARIIERGVRQCSLTVPEGPLRIRDAVMKALEADVENMVTLGKNLRELLVLTKNVHVTTELGTDLHLVLAGTGVAVDCGRWNPDLRVDNIVYMPGGIVETLPVETSANGLVIVPTAYLRRAHSGWIRRLQLHFDRGKVKSVQSQTRLCVFKRILEEAKGDKNVIAEFAIGVNPNVQNIIGSMRVDELMGGSVHIAIGDNYGWMNGKNKSDLHWDFILPEATVELEGKTILERGEFQLS